MLAIPVSEILPLVEPLPVFLTHDDDELTVSAASVRALLDECVDAILQAVPVAPLSATGWTEIRRALLGEFLP